MRGIFQAAEEIMPGGAHDAIAAGALDGVDAVFAVHCDPSLDVGQVGLREGPLTAACDQVTVSLHGRGGHTSRPQLTEDLTYALAKVVTDVPAALSRRLDPRAGAALVWGTISAGRAPNVIPSTGECQGTLRMLDAQAWLTVGPLLEEIVHAVVQPYGVQAKVERVKGVPPVVNTATGIEAFRLASLAGGMHPVPTSQSLGGEDFSWYLAHTDGAMARLGTRTHGGPTYDLHQGDLVVDEDAIACGARLLSSVAVLRRAPHSARHAAHRDAGGDMTASEQDVDWEALRAEAVRMTTLAYAPYSHFPVGVAGLVDDGRIVSGCNVENAAYGVTLCAECGMVSRAARDRRRPARRGVRASTGNGDALMPCGRCRQLLWENGAPDMPAADPRGRADDARGAAAGVRPRHPRRRRPS